jgi:hypothetical protein
MLGGIINMAKLERFPPNIQKYKINPQFTIKGLFYA